MTTTQGEPVTVAMVQALETRLRHCEDQLALYQLIMTYGPAVDSGWRAWAAALARRMASWMSSAATSR